LQAVADRKIWQLAASGNRIELSVVIPAYNEASRIEQALSSTYEFLLSRYGAFEIVVIDDGSKDATTQVVESFSKSVPGDRVRLISLSHNCGKGAALRAGVAQSRGERFLIMDADLATPIEELDTLWRALDDGAVVATGSRAIVGAHITRSQSIIRVLLGRLGNVWIRILAVPRIHDTQCGFKLFQGDVGRELFRRCREDRFGIDVEVLGWARKMRQPIAEIGVRWAHQSGSKVKWRDYLDVLIKVPKIAWSVRVSSWFFRR
jgi:glycosyltransferase involved in cell wall biosynthesis